MLRRPHTAAPIALLLAASAIPLRPARAEETTGEVLTGEVSGLVLERGSREPIAGALVSAGEREVESDDRGRFALPVPAGVSTLEVEREGYRGRSVRTRVGAGRRRRLVVVLDLSPDTGVFVTEVRARPFPEETSRVSLSGPELRTVPGTGGDPLRVMESLPSVLAVMSVLPYYFVRGAPPSATGFYLDGIRLPTLFHLGVGQPVVHPALIERVDFFPGGAPAELGWNVGGVLRARSRRIRSDRIHAEWEAGLTEVNGIVQVPINDVLRASVSGRYSFLGYWLQLFAPEMGLQTGDYQARLEWDVAPGHRLSLLGLGAYSGLSYSTNEEGEEGTDFRIHFHRVVARYELLRRRGLQLEARAWLGFDETAFSESQAATMWATGPQLSLRWGPAAWLELVAGAELEGRWFPGGGEVAEDDDFSLFWQGRDALLAGTHLSVVLHPTRRTDISVGGRLDVHAVGDETDVWVDLRCSFRHRFARFLALHAEVGTFHQPQSFIIHLPGFGSLPIDVPPQESLQISQGVEVSLPWQLTLDVQLFHTSFAHLSEADRTAGETDIMSWLSGDGGFGALTGRAYGVELQLRRRLGEDLFGWISYTVSYAERDYSVGRAPHDFDRTHVLSLVASWYIGWGYRVGGRVQLSSGRPYTPMACQLDPRNPFSPPMCFQTGGYNGERLPPFFRLDLRMDKEWTFRLFGLALFLELWNVTFTREALGATCECEDGGGQRVVEPDFPLIGLQLGVRGVY